VFVVAAVVFASGQGQKKPPPVVRKSRSGQDKNLDESDRWLLFKLTSSQAMCTDLTRGNLKGVAKHARASTVVDVLQYWLRSKEFLQRSEYHKQLNKYQYAVRELARHAEDDNIDGAFESWLDVNRSCVQCHKLLRDSVEIDSAQSEATPAE